MSVFLGWPLGGMGVVWRGSGFSLGSSRLFYICHCDFDDDNDSEKNLTWDRRRWRKTRPPFVPTIAQSQREREREREIGKRK